MASTDRYGQSLFLPRISVCSLQHVPYRHGDHWSCLYALLHCSCLCLLPYGPGDGFVLASSFPSSQGLAIQPLLRARGLLTLALHLPSAVHEQLDQAGQLVHLLTVGGNISRLEGTFQNYKQGVVTLKIIKLMMKPLQVGAKRISQLPFFLCLFVHVCMSTYVFMYAHMCSCMHRCICVCQCLSVLTCRPDGFFSHILPYFLRQALSLGLEVPISTRLAGQQAPAMLLASPSQGSSDNHTESHLAFTWLSS